MNYQNSHKRLLLATPIKSISNMLSTECMQKCDSLPILSTEHCRAVRKPVQFIVCTAMPNYWMHHCSFIFGSYGLSKLPYTGITNTLGQRQHT